MSFSAMIPVDKLLASNTALDEKGFGFPNFSVPVYTGPAVTHAAFHACDDPVFYAAVQELDGVIFEDEDDEENPISGNPVERTQTLIEDQGAIWGAQAPDLPDEGVIKPGELYRHGDMLWSVIQQFDRSTYGDEPTAYPSMIRRVRNPMVAEPWHQPMDQFDAYMLENPFTGEADRAELDGQIYETLLDNNVWRPDQYPQGWNLIENEGA